MDLCILHVPNPSIFSCIYADIALYTQKMNRILLAYTCTCTCTHTHTHMQSREVPLDVHVVYIYTKTSIFGRNKQLVGPEVSAKLHVRRIDDHYHTYLYNRRTFTLCTLYTYRLPICTTRSHWWTSWMSQLTSVVLSTTTTDTGSTIDW